MRSWNRAEPAADAGSVRGTGSKHAGSSSRPAPAFGSYARKWIWGGILGWSGLLAITTVAEPYTPVSDDEVLERVPLGVRSADVRRQREDLAQDPENLRDSLSMAGSYLETSRVEGDPRFLGYAQSILGPWWNQASPPLEVRVVRAEVFVLRFEFDRAQSELEGVLAVVPDHGPAWAVSGEIFLARGDPKRARDAFERARSSMTACASAIAMARCDRGVSGREASIRALEGWLPTVSPASDAGAAGSATVAQRQEILSLLADARARQGAIEEAASAFAQGRRLGRRDVRILVQEADFELDRDRPEAVIALAKGESAHDGLAVRLLEAWKRRGESDPEAVARFEALRRQLEKRLEDRRARGDASALPEEVRYWVRVRPDPVRASERAEELWAVRRTLDDARWVLEAANLSESSGLRDRVGAWLRLHDIQEPRRGALRGPGKGSG